MTLSDRVQSALMPPIDSLNVHMSKLIANGRDVTSLGQSVPFFGPPSDIISAAIESLQSSPSIHSYGPDIGNQELRIALAEKLANYNNVIIDPKKQLIVTPGSNQAFMLAMITILNPGDEVAIAAPYYFNHHMAIELAGGRVIEIPLEEEDGFQIHLEEVESVITQRTKALVITSPNNPTGAVYNPNEIERVARYANERGIYLIADEAYEAFCFDASNHFSPASIPDVAESVITIGSFSKTFGMTGWRVGYIYSNSRFFNQAIKVQDATSICAPIISQVAATAALNVFETFSQTHLQELIERRHLLSETISTIPLLNWNRTSGALFAFIRSEYVPVDKELSLDILDSVGVLTIPGSAFGKQWSNYLRLSYGASSRTQFENALVKLNGYFDDVSRM